MVAGVQHRVLDGQLFQHFRHGRALDRRVGLLAGRLAFLGGAIEMAQRLAEEFLVRQQLGQHFRLLDGHRADQNRLVLLAPLDQVVDDGGVFFGRGAIDLVVIVFARNRLVGRDFDHA